MILQIIDIKTVTLITIEKRRRHYSEKSQGSRLSPHREEVSVIKQEAVVGGAVGFFSGPPLELQVRDARITHAYITLLGELRHTK